MEEAVRESVGRVLRDEIEDAGRGELGKHWRCPSGLRSRVVTYAERSRREGETLGEIAGRLGLVESTLARWLRTAAGNRMPGFREVAIVPSGEVSAPVNPPPSGLSLVSPRGYRVEGLDPPTLAALLRVLG